VNLLRVSRPHEKESGSDAQQDCLHVMPRSRPQLLARAAYRGYRQLSVP
jgi:hypothetical protein